jgi:hypothetical protein
MAGYSAWQIFIAAGPPHEIESEASRGRHAEAHDPPLRLCGDRCLSLIPA